MSDVAKTVARAAVSVIAETMPMLEQVFGNAPPIRTEGA